MTTATETTTYYCPPCDLFETYGTYGETCRNCHGDMVPVGNSRPVILDGAAAIGIARRGDKVGDTIELRPATCARDNYTADPALTDERTLDLEDWLFYCSEDCKAQTEYEDAQYAIAGF